MAHSCIISLQLAPPHPISRSKAVAAPIKTADSKDGGIVNV